MRALENDIIKKAEKIVCISTSDYKHFIKLYPKKTVFLPHTADTGNYSWNGNDRMSLFFCGPIGHMPNREAIEWMVHKLSPILPDGVKIKIAGKGTDTLPKDWKRDNIEYLGFISHEELNLLYQNCGAFISPIVHGSGVKVKVTEALSYGMPVIATKESLEGLDYIDIEPLLDRNDLQKTKENIEKLLNKEEKLKQYSLEIIEKVKKTKEHEENILENIIDETIYKGNKYDVTSKNI